MQENVPAVAFAYDSNYKMLSECKGARKAREYITASNDSEPRSDSSRVNPDTAFSEARSLHTGRACRWKTSDPDPDTACTLPCSRTGARITAETERVSSDAGRGDCNANANGEGFTTTHFPPARQRQRRSFGGAPGS